MRGSYPHHHHPEFRHWNRSGMFFPPFLLLIGIAALVIIVTSAPWLPLLVIGFIVFRVLSRQCAWGRSGYGSMDWKPKRDFASRYGENEKPKRGDDSEYV